MIHIIRTIDRYSSYSFWSSSCSNATTTPRLPPLSLALINSSKTFFKFSSSAAAGLTNRNRISISTTSSSPSKLRSSDSYLIGSTESPLLEHTLPFHWSNHILPIHHDRLALISRDEPPSRLYQTDHRSDCLRLTYSQLDQAIGSLTSALHQLGIRKGDRVGINTSNHSIYPILQWATAKMGAILATINPAYAPSELINAIKKVDCKILFSTPSFKSKDMIPMLSSLIEESDQSLSHLIIVDNESHHSHHHRQPQQQLGGGGGGGKRSRSKSEIFQAFDPVLNSTSSSSSSTTTIVLDLDQLLTRHPSLPPPTLPPPQLEAQEIINLQFTSGTTGFPKAVSLSHRNLLNNAHHIAERMNLTSKDVVCNVPPMFHCFGSVIGNLASFVKGATVVIPSETFDPKAVIRTVSQESCTVLHGVGTMFLAEINELDRIDSQVLDLSSLRTGVIAGSPVSDELMNQIEDRLGMKELTILYGMTETSPGSFQTRAHDDRLKRTTTVGTIFPHTRAKVVDLKTGEIVRRDQRGELLVSGYSVQKGYWNDPTETAKAMIEDQEGRVWMRSGDIASMDSSGYLRIVGRAKDVIIRGGENVYPVIIENCIIKLDGVLDVAVVSVPDALYGETVGAFVKRKPAGSPTTMTTNKPAGIVDLDRRSVAVTEKDVQEIVRNHLAGANVPKYVWFLDLLGDHRSDFPMTASGKIKKTELIDWVSELIPPSPPPSSSSSSSSSSTTT